MNQNQLEMNQLAQRLNRLQKQIDEIGTRQEMIDVMLQIFIAQNGGPAIKTFLKNLDKMSIPLIEAGEDEQSTKTAKVENVRYSLNQAMDTWMERYKGVPHG